MGIGQFLPFCNVPSVFSWFVSFVAFLLGRIRLPLRLVLCGRQADRQASRQTGRQTEMAGLTVLLGKACGAMAIADATSPLKLAESLYRSDTKQ